MHSISTDVMTFFITNDKEEGNCIFIFISSRFTELHSALFIFDMKMRE